MNSKVEGTLILISMLVVESILGTSFWAVAYMASINQSSWLNFVAVLLFLLMLVVLVVGIFESVIRFKKTPE